MIIDVIDLELKNLQFSRNYDTNIYLRGKTLYNREKVEVEKVEKLDDKNYFVEANVDGNFDTYETTLNIANNLIKNSTCTCEDYYKGNLCKHIIATSMEVVKPHYASTIEGRRKLLDQKREEAKKRQEEMQRKQEAERKRREYEIKYYTGLQTIQQFKESSKEKIKENINLKELYEDTKELKDKNVGDLATSIKLEYTIELENMETLRVSFKIGQTRMYVLGDILQFYNAYKNETELYYGKQLKFIPKSDNFIEASKPIFDYIIKYAEMIDYNEKYTDYRMASSFYKYIFISSNEIEKFFELNKNKEIIVNIYHDKEKFEFTDKKLNIECIFTRELVETPQYNYWYYEGTTGTEEYVLKLNISDYLLLISSKYIYVFYNNLIYKITKDKNMVNMFELFKNEDKIIIPEDKIEEFKKYVFPQIKYLKIQNLPEENKDEVFVVDDLASKILLDVDENSNILLQLIFCYREYEFNILEKGYKKYVKENNIIRDIPAETDIIKRIFMDGFEMSPEKKQFIMKNTDDMYNFLSYKIEGYMNDFEVLATDKFKNKQIKQPKISNVGIKIDNGLLELDISKINIDLSELKDVLKDYKIKKKYHKLKSGDLLDLSQSEDLNLLDEMTTTLDIDYNKVKNGMINLPINRCFYLEKLSEIK